MIISGALTIALKSQSVGVVTSTVDLDNLMLDKSLHQRGHVLVFQITCIMTETDRQTNRLTNKQTVIELQSVAVKVLGIPGIE